MNTSLQSFIFGLEICVFRLNLDQQYLYMQMECLSLLLLSIHFSCYLSAFFVWMHQNCLFDFSVFAFNWLFFYVFWLQSAFILKYSNFCVWKLFFQKCRNLHQCDMSAWSIVYSKTVHWWILFYWMTGLMTNILRVCTILGCHLFTELCKIVVYDSPWITIKYGLICCLKNFQNKGDATFKWYSTLQS